MVTSDANTALESGLSRRSLLAGAGTLAALSVMGGVVISTAPAHAASPLSLNQVKAMAVGETGRTLAQVKSDLAVTDPWLSWSGEWCAWFVTWLLHNNGLGMLVDAEDPYPFYRSQGRVGTVPTTGALIFFGSTTSSIDHVGLVYDSANGVETVEGNAGSNPWPSSVVHHNTNRGQSAIGYAYPVYSGYDSLPGVGGNPGGAAPVPTLKGTDVFYVARNGSVYLIVPQGAQNYAVVMGGQDNLGNIPMVTFNWDTSWAAFKNTVVNASSLPA
ncbi:CHAP domain-containing protein [Planctomonas sp. JC2975]|uniref:CHAP domain-containing protein n=1 Tax=Planctomonas sp. JC2975 TaxID=2729626 RepID=UPI001474AF25|nr:CHAP domain-containing protein [Planctomonas sp. JC2975]NNC10712.1 CHAP domain-containing protein [Planctomonas sp. JC2975]